MPTNDRIGWDEKGVFECLQFKLVMSLSDFKLHVLLLFFRTATV